MAWRYTSFRCPTDLVFTAEIFVYVSMPRRMPIRGPRTPSFALANVKDAPGGVHVCIYVGPTWVCLVCIFCGCERGGALSRAERERVRSRDSLTLSKASRPHPVWHMARPAWLGRRTVLSAADQDDRCTDAVLAARSQQQGVLHLLHALRE